MFGVTTPCVQAVTRALEADYDCLVFHATGTGGRAMEKLVDSGLIAGVIDVTTTEVADFIVGGTLACTDGPASAPSPVPACPMSARSAPATWSISAASTPSRSASDRKLYVHNPQITLMRTTAGGERRDRTLDRLASRRLRRAAAIPAARRWGVGDRRPGQPFHDPAADEALFAGVEATLKPRANRRIERLPYAINAPEFAAALVEAYREVAI